VDLKPRQHEIDEAANMWDKTKDPKYKDLWYKLIKDYYENSQFLSKAFSNSRSDTAPTVPNNTQ
jgi:hypothetical protein